MGKDEYKYNPITHIIEKVQVQRGKLLDDAIVGEIHQIAKKNEILTTVVLNERSVIRALLNAIPTKPYPMRMDDLIFGYSCPACIMSVDKSDNHCRNCGKKLDWSAKDECS